MQIETKNDRNDGTWQRVISKSLRGTLKKTHSIFKDIIQIEVELPPFHPIFDKFIFEKSFDHVDLPPSPRIFDKNH